MSVAGIGLLGPGLPGWQASRAVLTGAEPWCCGEVALPPPGDPARHGAAAHRTGRAAGPGGGHRGGRRQRYAAGQPAARVRQRQRRLDHGRRDPRCADPAGRLRLADTVPQLGAQRRCGLLVDRHRLPAAPPPAWAAMDWTFGTTLLKAGRRSARRSASRCCCASTTCRCHPRSTSSARWTACLRWRSSWYRRGPGRSSRSNGSPMRVRQTRRPDLDLRLLALTNPAARALRLLRGPGRAGTAAPCAFPLLEGGILVRISA